MARSTAYDQYPQHILTLEPQAGTARAVFEGRVVAESRRALRLLEGKYPPVLYFPPDDVQQDQLRKTDHSTHCPFKGDASYWSIGDEPGPGENAVWGYEDPFDQMLRLKGHFAFYPDRVQFEVDD